MRAGIIIVCLVVHCTISHAQKSYDSTLMKPDIASDGIHGYNLTKLGCLVHLPWELAGIGESSPDPSEDDFALVSKLDSIMSNLVLELQKDGSIKFWFKQDYLVRQYDTVALSGGGIAISKHTWNSKQVKVRKMFMNGSWKMNAAGDSIKIKLGQSYYRPISFEGRLAMLDASNMCIVGSVSGLAANKPKGKKNVVIKSCFLH